MSGSTKSLDIRTQFEIYQSAIAKWNSDDLVANAIPSQSRPEQLVMIRSIDTDKLVASAWLNPRGEFLRLEFPKPALALN